MMPSNAPFYAPTTEKTLSYLQTLLIEKGAYHTQKENVFQIGVSIQCTIFAGVIAVEGMKGFADYPLITRILGFVILWIPIHIYIRRQLRFARWSAIMYAALYSAYTETMMLGEPVYFPLSAIGPVTKPESSRKLPNWVDFIYPYPASQVRSDIDSVRYPAFLADKIREEIGKINKKPPVEWMHCGMSAFMFALCIMALCCRDGQAANEIRTFFFFFNW